MPVYKNKKNNTWYIRTYIKDANGKAKQITRNNKEWIGREGKRKAEREEIKLKIDYEKNLISKKNVQKKSVVFDDMAEKYLLEQKKNNKESTYYDRCVLIKKRILPYFKGKKADHITREEILRWHKILDDQNYSMAYKQKCHTVLDNVLEIGINFFNEKTNVARQVGNFKIRKEEKEKIAGKTIKIKYISYHEFCKFISVINDIFWKTFFHTLYFTGARKGEIQALTWNDIDFNNNTIKINKTLTTKCFSAKWKVTSTKNLKVRNIDIDNSTKKILKKFFNLRKREQDFSLNDFVFGDNKEPIKSHKMDYHKNKYFNLSHVKNITIHQFRHSHVSLMVNEYLKANQTDTKKFFIMMSNRMGHSIEVMERTYLHLFPDVQTPIVDLINNLNYNNLIEQD